VYRCVPPINHGALDVKLNCLAVQRNDVLTSHSCRIALTRLKTSRSALVLVPARPGDRSAQPWAGHVQGVEPRKGRFRRPGHHSVPTQNMRDVWRSQRNGSRSSALCCWCVPAWRPERGSSGRTAMVSVGPTRRSHCQALSGRGARGTVARPPWRRGPPAARTNTHLCSPRDFA
jgi:hypothetical protein